MLLVVFRGHTRQHKQHARKPLKDNFKASSRGETSQKWINVLLLLWNRESEFSWESKWGEKRQSVGERGYNAFPTKKQGRDNEANVLHRGWENMKYEKWTQKHRRAKATSIWQKWFVFTTTLCTKGFRRPANYIMLWALRLLTVAMSGVFPLGLIWTDDTGAPSAENKGSDTRLN